MRDIHSARTFSISDFSTKFLNLKGVLEQKSKNTPWFTENASIFYINLTNTLGQRLNEHCVKTCWHMPTIEFCVVRASNMFISKDKRNILSH